MKGRKCRLRCGMSYDEHGKFALGSQAAMILAAELHLRGYSMFPSTWPFVSPTSL